MRNAVIFQEALDGFKDMNRILWQVLTACTIPRDEHTHFATLQGQDSKRQEHMVSHFDPMIGADRSVAYSPVTFPVIQRMLTSTRTQECQAHDANVGTSK